MLSAAKLIGEIAGIGRFASDAKLARIAGPHQSPHPQATPDRHRLDRAATANSTTGSGQPSASVLQVLTSPVSFRSSRDCPAAEGPAADRASPSVKDR